MDGMPAKTLTWNDVLYRTYTLYAQHFATFLKIALPPSLIAWAYHYGYHLAIEQARASGWLNATSMRSLPLMAALGFTNGAVYWIISAFFFAAVASQIFCDPTDGSSELSDGFSAARTRIAPVLMVALLIWVLFCVARSIGTFALIELFGSTPAMRAVMSNFWAGTAIFSVLVLMIAGLLSRFGLAIPVLMAQPEISFSQALKKSMTMTEGWEPYFMMFLAKSAVVGFLGYWGANILLDQLWFRGLLTRATYPWAQSLLYIGLAAVLESPLFISFCVLYRDVLASEEEETGLTAPAIG